MHIIITNIGGIIRMIFPNNNLLFFEFSNPISKKKSNHALG